MSIELKVPDVGESIQEVQIRNWRKQEGDHVEEDEELVELETDKASLDLPAPAAGVLQNILIGEGETAQIGDVLAILEEGRGKSKDQASDEDDSSEAEEPSTANEKAKKKRKTNKQKKSKQEAASQPENKATKGSSNGKKKNKSKKKEAAAEKQKSEKTQTTELVDDRKDSEESAEEVQSTPAARREMRRYHLSATEITPRGDRIRPEDVRRHVEQQAAEKQNTSNTSPADESTADEEVVPMSFLRQKISERLVRAQQNAAILTTFNEIDMSAIKQLREERGEAFQAKHEVKLGFMSFFIKATVEAIKQQPMVNAQVRDGTNIVYFKRHHIGIAIGSSHGLVVPVLRNADQMSFAEIERAIDSFANQAEEESLQPADLQGGTFTISNGGIYGSLLSTPIINPPQSGVLGMHQIQDRPVVRNKEVVVRPMMYVALSYDHRIIDGKEAVTCLRTIKECIEDPMRMLLDN